MVRIFSELLLFLTPFMVFLVYRAASRDMKIGDRWPLTWLVLIGAAIAVLGLIIPPLLQPSDQGKCYQAAQYIDGKAIPSKEVDCGEATPPGQGTMPGSEGTEPPPPVAPRDRDRPTPQTDPLEPPAPG
jgi:hypothetical protein